MDTSNSATMSGVAKPDWKPDQSALQCNGCQAGFTLLRRRHHCRMCGSIFCDSCSSFYSILPAEYGYTGQQRLCKSCNNVFEQKKQFYETDALVAQFQLRSSQLFEFSKSLGDIGHVKHGLRKSYCLSKNKSTGDDCVVSIITPQVSTCPWPMTNEKKKRKFEKTLMALKHSQIMTPLKVEVSGANDKILVVRNYCKQGSLRDLIYKSKPLSPYDTKYIYTNNSNGSSTNKSNLQTKQIQKYSKQILESLLYLKSKGIQHQHLHTANVLIVNDQYIQLVDIENNLLGLRPLYHDSLSQQYGNNFKENPEVVCFGHVLFEMIVGLPLTDHSNINSFIPLFPDKVFLFLQQIFSDKCPTLEELCKNQWFEVTTTLEQQSLQGGKLKKSQSAFIKDTSGKFESPKASLSSSFSSGNINKLSLSNDGNTLSAADRRKSMKLPSNTNLVGFNQTSSSTTTIYQQQSSPVHPSAQSNIQSISSPSTSKPNTTASPPPPPPPPTSSAPPPPPPPAKTSVLKDLPPKQDGRNSLLESIRNPDNFKKLKKAPAATSNRKNPGVGGLKKKK